MRHEHHEHHAQEQQGRGERPRHRDRGEFGFGRPGGPRGRGGRTRRGDIRYALLSALSDGPAHGYELIQRLEERTGGRWKPSPGSVYPTLQMMEEAGLVTAAQQDEKRVYSVTDEGKKLLAERVAEGGGMPWMSGEGPEGHGALRHAVGQLVMAAKQVGMAGNPAHVETATGIVNDARRKLYQLLAES